MKIAARLKPFSHLPGASCPIPGTCSILEAFPTLIRLDGLNYPLPLTGPVKGFTLLMDLEKHCVFVFGQALEGHFRLRLEGHDTGVHLFVEKGPIKPFFFPRHGQYIAKRPFERLSLGSHKAQNWEEIVKRADLKEIVPILFTLGQTLPLIEEQPLQGTARLLQLPSARVHLAAHLENFFKAAFHKLLVPRLIDDQHQGLVPEELATGNPFFLIQEGTKVIRSLFFRQNERRLSLLPQLPVPFDAGRLLDIDAPGIGSLDLEWSKKTVRRILMHASTSGEVILELPKEIKTFRVGKRIRQAKDEPVLLSAGQSILIDQFRS